MGEGAAAILRFLKQPSSSVVYPTTCSSSLVFANSLPHSSLCSLPPIPISHSTKRVSNFMAKDGDIAAKAVPLGLDPTMEEEYSSQSKLLSEFTKISTIDKAWTFNSDTGEGSRAMFLISQPDLLANKQRKYILSANISKDGEGVTFQWAPFPIEMTDASAIVPSPSGSKLLVIRAPENESPTKFEIWGSSLLEKEFHVPQSVHGSVYTDGWFEGISWNSDETLIAYVAEEPSPPKPTFNATGYKQGASSEKDCGSWKGLGEWEEDWGETYAGKRRPCLFVINIKSGEVCAIEGIAKSLSVGQPVWSPPAPGLPQYLVFVGWPADKRKLGMKYCYNRPCALYALSAPFHDLESGYLQAKGDERKDSLAVKLTEGISSAFHPRFSPDGKFLVFISAKSAVDSGAHSATKSLHRIDWPADGKPCPSAKITDVIPVLMCPDDDCFPGLYSSSLIDKPWISDGYSIILPSIWGSTQVILSVNILSGNVVRISPAHSNFSWNVLTLEGDNIIAVYSSPVDIPQIKYGSIVKASKGFAWNWLDVSNSISKCSEKVGTLLSSLQFSIMKIPVRDVSQNLTKGAQKPFEAIYVWNKSKKSERCDPLIVVLHGGPHSVSLGSVGFGEEALQSLPGNIGSQDVNDVLAAIDHVIHLGFADPSKIAVLGGSHGGFLTTHLIGQAPHKFVAAVARNPVCNIASMVGVTDIPDWCFIEAYGSQGNTNYTEAPTAEHLNDLYKKSPISHISKVKTPTLLLLGAQDLRVPVSNGLQYARALKEKGVENKVIVFPNDTHGIDRPQSDFESFLNIGVWFKKYCK